jgi:hypothetical protein
MFLLKAPYMESWFINVNKKESSAQTMLGASCCFLEQETLHSLPSIGLFQEWIRECVYKL